MLVKSISKNSFILGLFALITAGLLAGTFMSTQDRIAAAERRAAEKALLEIVPRARHNNDMLADTWMPPIEDAKQLGLKDPEPIHLARKNGEPVAAIIPSLAPDGYSGDIKLIVGINLDGTIAGVRVLRHKETPGLGDKIDLNKSDWVLDFNDLSLQQPPASEWTVNKAGGYFDQFTGATITPRAVINRVKLTLEYFNAHKEQIFGQESAS